MRAAARRELDPQGSDHRSRRACWLPVVLAALLLACGLVDTAPAAVGEGRILTRPGPSTEPTRVAIGLYLLDLSVIDDAAQTLTVDFILWLRWRDPRLADPAAGQRGLRLIEVWNPRVVIVNDRHLEKRLPDLVQVDGEGGVVYAQRFLGTVSSTANLADFPFDDQVFQIQAIAGGYTAEEIELAVEPGRTGRSARLSAVDWQVAALTGETRPFEYTADGRVFPSAVFAFPAERHTGYYVWKLIFPLLVVVLMSWTVFWIDPALSSAQIGVAATSILTLIAYQLVLGGLVPKLSYMTRADRFIVGATILVFLALVEVIVTSSVAGRDRLPLAKKIDKAARIVFPLAFLLLLFIAFRW